MEFNNLSHAEIPTHFFCPITQDVMQDPLISRDGQTYERQAILTWLQSHGNVCPLTRQPLNVSDLIQHRALKSEIKRWYRTRGLTSWYHDDDADEDDDTKPRKEIPMMLATFKPDKIDPIKNAKNNRKVSLKINDEPIRQDDISTPNVCDSIKSANRRRVLVPLLQRITSKK